MGLWVYGFMGVKVYGVIDFFKFRLGYQAIYFIQQDLPENVIEQKKD